MFRFPFGLTSASDTSWRVDRVAESSRALASATCSAAIGGTTVRQLKATVYQGGLILDVRFRARRAVRASEIRTYEREYDGPTMGLVIAHEAPDVPSPLVLFLGEDSAVEKQLRHIEGMYGSVERPGDE